MRDMFRLPLLPDGAVGDGYTDFEWVSVEERYPATAIETATTKGWAWWELAAVEPLMRPEVDAFRLLAAFLAHWDNKSENQRLVCLDDPPVTDGATCGEPLAMIHDLGATFGPPKVNLAQWRALPVWHDRTGCLVSMRALPFDGASFPDVEISEAGRRLLLERLEAVPLDEIAEIFRRARFPEYQTGTDAARDVAAWTEAYAERVDQIARARCS
jgi:hypothetical protein